MRLRPPIHYFGGKQLMIPTILEMITQHRIYVEPFGGSASVLFAKRRSEVEVYNDIDPELVNLYRVIQNDELCRRLQLSLFLTPHSRAEYRLSCIPAEDELERARRLFVNIRMSMMGRRYAGWGTAVTTSSHGMAQALSSYISAISRIWSANERLKGVIIRQEDWRTILDEYDSPDTFFYLDPPYVPDTWRMRGKGYAFELSVEDHRELVSRIMTIRGKVLLSGYENDIYTVLEENGWGVMKVERPVPSSRGHSNRISNGEEIRRMRRHEVLWWNFPNQAQQGRLF